jgi:hypothetical protein
MFGVARQSRVRLIGTEGCRADGGGMSVPTVSMDVPGITVDPKCA